MTVVIIRFPGTNCEYDTKYAFDMLKVDTVIVDYTNDTLPQDTSLVVLPGGFSYGDYLRTGAMAKMANIMKAVKKFASGGGYVLGICNGFQILCEAGLLSGALKRNDNGHFISKHQYIKVANNDNKFLKFCKKDEVLNIPIANHDGAYYIDKDSLQSLRKNDQILLQYSDSTGNISHLNGSVEYIAGICNKDKNIFGLMPHPERAMEILLGSIDGKNMLKGLVR